VRTKKTASVGTVDLLKRAELAVRGCAEAVLLQFDLTPAQFLVLFRLKYATAPVSSADLARAAGIRPQSVVDIIGPLERDGLIRRREAPEHRRILRITLTAAGEQLFARALPAAAQLERELLYNLTAAELSGLRKGLEKLLANAEVHDLHPLMRRSAAAAAMRAELARGSVRRTSRSRKPSERRKRFTRSPAAVVARS
jgi:DNA-binding MarR family transcriptional regulator